MGLVMKVKAPHGDEYAQAYAHVSQLRLDFDNETGTFAVLVHRDLESFKAGLGPVAAWTVNIVRDAQPAVAAKGAVIEEDTKRVLQPAILARPAVPSFAEVFGAKRTTSDALAACYAFAKTQPEYEGAVDAGDDLAGV